MTVASDGKVWVERGRWAGDYKDWRVRRKQVAVLPERVAEFSALLRPYRPQRLGTERCQEVYSDMPEVHVSWGGGSGEAKLIYNFGCDPALYPGLMETLRAAPDVLEIRDLSAPRPEWTATTR